MKKLFIFFALIASIGIAAAQNSVILRKPIQIIYGGDTIYIGFSGDTAVIYANNRLVKIEDTLIVKDDIILRDSTLLEIIANAAGGAAGLWKDNSGSVSLIDSSAIVLIDSVEFRARVSFADTSITLPSGSTETLDLTRRNVWLLTTGAGDFTLDYSNPKVGTYTIQITQGGTARAITWATGKFIFPDGIVPALTASAGAIDIASCFYNGSKMVVSFLYDCK